MTILIGLLGSGTTTLLRAVLERSGPQGPTERHVARLPGRVA